MQALTSPRRTAPLPIPSTPDVRLARAQPCVLIVDADPERAGATVAAYLMRGFRTLSCARTDEALDLARGLGPQIIVAALDCPAALAAFRKAIRACPGLRATPMVTQLIDDGNDGRST